MSRKVVFFLLVPWHPCNAASSALLFETLRNILGFQLCSNATSPKKKASQPTRRYSAGSLTALNNIIELNSSIRFKKKSNSDIFFSADVLKWPRRTEFLEGEAKTNCAPNYKPSGAQNGGVSDSEHSPQTPEEGSPRATISSSLIMLCRHPWPDRRGHDLRARLDKHLLAHPLLFYSVLQGKLFNDFFC